MSFSTPSWFGALPTPPVQSSREEILQEMSDGKSQGVPKPVAVTVRANTNYDKSFDDEVPVSGRAVSFEIGDCLHIREKFNSDWWIGRLVQAGSGYGFVPSPTMLENLRRVQCKHTVDDDSTSRVNWRWSYRGPKLARRRPWMFVGKGSGPDLPPYKVIPFMRPIVLFGPSLKGYNITDSMQRGLIDSLKARFEHRITVKRITTDLSLAKKFPEHIPDAVVSEIEDIFELMKNKELVILDCDTIVHPAQLADTCLEPIMVYLRINSPEVLKRLITWRGKYETTNLDIQMAAAEKLAQCPQEQFDVIIGEHLLAEAGKHLSTYLENYYKAIHSVGPVLGLRHSISEAVNANMRPSLNLLKRPSVGDDAWEQYQRQYQYQNPGRVKSSIMARPEKLTPHEIVVVFMCFGLKIANRTETITNSFLEK